MPNKKNKVSDTDASTDRDSVSSQDEASERARINSETAKIAWGELQRFFAQGHTVRVSPELDLVDVAWEMSRDNREKVEFWMGAGLVGQVTDAEAVEWFEANAQLWCVVVRPWVLVQPVVVGIKH